MRNTNSPTAPRRVTTAERKKSALALRIGGLSFQAIGDKLGVTRQAAHALVVNALRDTNAQTAEAADELRRLELERLDTAQAAIWEAVLKGDVQAVDRFVRISKRRGELTGIDAPTKSEVKVTDADIDSAIEQELAKLAAGRESGAVSQVAEPNSAGE